MELWPCLATEAVDLNINKGKIKILQYNTAFINRIILDGEGLEDVKTFTYLSSVIDEHSGSDADMKQRIGKPRAANLQWISSKHLACAKPFLKLMLTEILPININKVDRHGRVEIVSVDRLKTAHVNDSALCDNLRFNARPIIPSGILKSHSDPALDASETPFSRPGQQHALSALSTDETAVSRPDRQTTPPLTSNEIAGSRNTNETTVSCSGRRLRLPVRFRD
ncbi:unnamed protein product [Schistosoma margrebowiei]|uniref:Uncharacterized protein n=1 Tax=Schistosoma margrebowiei TaxID=48269 RepID=A0A183M7S9_9TREM|nr:unnamed protein product [Schistosoma margrebowiei]